MRLRRSLLVFSLLSVVVSLAAPSRAAEKPTVVLNGLQNPESVCLGPDGALYVTEIGEPGKDGDGKLTVIKDGKPAPFASGLDDPKGIVLFKDAFLVTDKTRVVK